MISEVNHRNKLHFNSLEIEQNICYFLRFTRLLAQTEKLFQIVITFAVFLIK